MFRSYLVFTFVRQSLPNRNEGFLADTFIDSTGLWDAELPWQTAKEMQQDLAGSSILSKSQTSFVVVRPTDSLLKPTARMIELLTHLLVGQANAGKKHRSIILSGMHSLVEDSAEEQDLLKLETNFKQAHGAMHHLEDGRSYFSNGPGTLQVPFSMFAEHRKKFVAELQKRIADMDPALVGHRGRLRHFRSGVAGGTVKPYPAEEKYDFIIFEGGILRHFYDTDMELHFRQEANFFWLFGVREPNVKAAIDLRSGESYLFVEVHGKGFQLLSGMNATGENAFEWWKEKYEVDHVFYARDMESVLIKAITKGEASNSRPGTVSVILADEPHDQHGQSVGFVPGQLTVRSDPGGVVSRTLRDLRLIKDRWELQIMQYVNDVSVESFIMAMQQSRVAAERPGIISMEWAAEGVFRYTSAMRGCLEVAYEASCPGGSNTAFFHYGADSWEPNSEVVGPNDVRMLDMAAAYFGYTGDVTISYPESGRFTEKQKALYIAVLEAQEEAEKAVRPGMTFLRLQEISERVLLKHLLDMGILKGDFEEIKRSGMIHTFMPHGIGHSLGLDVHDDPSPTQSFTEPFQANFVITVEPALYFNPSKLDELKADDRLNKYVDLDVLHEWKDIGGMRLEDDVLVTDTGCKVLTRVPRKPEDIEAVMSGAVVWKPWEQTIKTYSSSDSD